MLIFINILLNDGFSQGFSLQLNQPVVIDIRDFYLNKYNINQKRQHADVGTNQMDERQQAEYDLLCKEFTPAWFRYQTGRLPNHNLIN